MLEDRYADRLATDAIAAGHCVLVARRARAVIDLNRHPEELDSSSVTDLPRGTPIRTSPKLRGGLGLVPHRYHAAGDLWRRLPSFAEVQERIHHTHKPYHDRIAAILEAKRAAAGRAILIDIHSMPPLRAHGTAAPAQVVVGDRFGQSADREITRLAADIIAGQGFRVAINAPYAGGYTLERHGHPQQGIHALQIEVDRTLYLDGSLENPGPIESECMALIAALAAQIDRDSGELAPLAAE
jgi:N-formylglutamate amidohydrolase